MAGGGTAWADFFGSKQNRATPITTRLAYVFSRLPNLGPKAESSKEKRAAVASSGKPLRGLFVPNTDSMYQDWSASVIELHRCDRQWCRIGPIYHDDDARAVADWIEHVTGVARRFPTGFGTIRGGARVTHTAIEVLARCATAGQLGRMSLDLSKMMILFFVKRRTSSSPC